MLHSSLTLHRPIQDATMTTELTYSLLIPFTEDPSPSFVHGFEAGQVFMRLQAGQTIEDLTVHIANREVIEAMCRVHHKRAMFEPALADGVPVEGWMVFTAEPALRAVK